MPRPVIHRKVCFLPENNLFGPYASDPNKREILMMTVEEYESIRIIDFHDKSQETCAFEMQISRHTLQRVYHAAKKQIAEALIFGKILIIEGGNYQLCGVTNDAVKCNH